MDKPSITNNKKDFKLKYGIKLIYDNKPRNITSTSRENNNRSAKPENPINMIKDYGTIPPNISTSTLNFQPDYFKRMSHHSPFGGSSSYYYFQMAGLYPSSVRKAGVKTNNCYTVVKGNYENGLNIPLLIHSNELQYEQENDNNDNDDIENVSKMRKLYKSEFKVLSKYSIPIIFSEILRNTLLMMPILFIGHRTAFELAAITLGSTYCNVTGWCLLIGMDSALDTLCSQAYAAANTLEEKKIVGEILQRCFVILMTICIFIVGLWYIDNY
jgi:MATE family multidrug resistance protein